MALADGTLIEIVIDQRLLNQQVLNVWHYQITDHIATVSLVQLLEGYWNHIKATTRGLVSSALSDYFLSLRGRELNNAAGDYAEFEIPVSERAGTRATSTEVMPPFNAAGARLVVGTRLTRPGQKRWASLVEADNINGVLQASFRTPLIAHLNVMVAQMVLGAPAALETLQPIIASKDANGFVTAFQPITGYLINTNITSQNTRKIGRGS